MFLNRNRALRLIAVLFVICALLTMTPAMGLAQETSAVTHVVQPGENLFRIALRYGVDMNELARVNNISDQRRIFSGQVLVIPGVSQPNQGDVIVNPLVAGTPTTHIVQPGETLSGIARSYGLTVDQLLQSNNIANPNRIFRGQALTVWTAEPVAAAAPPPEPQAAPPPAVEAPAPTTNITYTVQPGEHLSQIARRYGMNWTTLAQVNGIRDPNLLYSGQQIIIPALNADGSIADLGIIRQPQINAPTPTITAGKQIIVDLSDSRVYAYQDGVLVYSALASTGLPATPTVTGDFRIWHRTRSQTMTGPGYSLPNVEWVQYFYQGYGLHGTYWHNNFGRPMSHGCVNLTNEDARWFYEFGEIGTPVRVQP